MQAVVFDLDGVLIDSEPVWDTVRRGLVQRAGRAWPRDATQAMQGMSTREWSTYLAELIGGSSSAQAVAGEVIASVARAYRTRLPLLPRAVDVVGRLSERFVLAVASSSPSVLIRTVLDAAGLTERFAVTVSSEEVPAGKPDPAVYLEAVRRLGVPAGAAVAVEDSSNGIRSAHGAGLATIAVPTTAFPPDADAIALAAAVVTSLDDITAEFVARLSTPGGATMRRSEV